MLPHCFGPAACPVRTKQAKRNTQFHAISFLVPGKINFSIFSRVDNCFTIQMCQSGNMAWLKTYCYSRNVGGGESPQSRFLFYFLRWMEMMSTQAAFWLLFVGKVETSNRQQRGGRERGGGGIHGNRPVAPYCQVVPYRFFTAMRFRESQYFFLCSEFPHHPIYIRSKSSLHDRTSLVLCVCVVL